MAPRTSDQLDFRLTPEQKHEMEAAGAISGRSIADFSVSVLVEHVEDAIRRPREIALSNKLRRVLRSSRPPREVSRRV